MAERKYHEMKLQFAVVTNMRRLLPAEVVWWYTPNGGKMTDKQRIKAFNLGELPGVSDLMVQWCGKLLCIELKVRKSKKWGIPETTNQSDAQMAFQAAVEDAGGAYEVCRSVDEVMRFLALHGVPTRETARSVSNMMASASRLNGNWQFRRSWTGRV